MKYTQISLITLFLIALLSSGSALWANRNRGPVVKPKKCVLNDKVEIEEIYRGYLPEIGTTGLRFKKPETRKIIRGTLPSDNNLNEAQTSHFQGDSNREIPKYLKDNDKYKRNRVIIDTREKQKRAPFNDGRDKLEEFIFELEKEVPVEEDSALLLPLTLPSKSLESKMRGNSSATYEVH